MTTTTSRKPSGGADYSNASIYKITCDDGRFYIGSTILPLATRFSQHRRAVDKGVTNSKVYRHIRALGGSEKARIELVKGDLGVTTRDELLRVEDSYIREALKSRSLCLNRNKPRATSEERLAREKMQKRMWTKVNRDIRRDAARGGGSITLAERVRKYYREHKPRRICVVRKSEDPEEIISCECGWDLKRSAMKGHRRSKEHKHELMRWLIIKRILHESGVIP